MLHHHRCARAALLGVLLLLAACAESGAPAPVIDPPPAGTSIQITVKGPLFRPALALAAPAAVILDYGDGSAVVSNYYAAGPHSLPLHEFTGSAPSRTVLLQVKPWSALSVLNLGFRAGDGGNDTGRTDVPVILLHPPSSAFPDVNDWDTLDAARVRGYVGEVTAVSNLQVATELLAFCCERQPLTVLDCSWLTKLKTVEAFFSSVKSTSFQGCAALRRCCLESTGARTNWRIEFGVRSEDEVLDLRDSPLLQDIRGTNGDRTGIRLHPGATATLWHLCTMNNYRMTGIWLGDDTTPLADLRAFRMLKECWISSSPLIPSLVVTNMSTDSIVATGCGLTNLDIRNQTQLREINLGGNPFVGVNLDGSTGLDRIYLGNCSLSQTLVDYVLATVDGWGTAITNDYYKATVDLSGNNAVPSTTGVAHRVNLTTRNWDVFVAE